MNKAIAATLTAALLLSMGTTTAFAASTTSGKTELKYRVAEEYTWSVPATIDFGENKGVNATDVVGAAGTGSKSEIEVSKNVIGDGKKLQITVESTEVDKSFVIKTGNTKVSYTIKVGSDSNAVTLSAPGTVLEVPAGTNTKTEPLTFTMLKTNTTAEVAGDYTGALTYTATVVDATATPAQNEN